MNLRKEYGKWLKKKIENKDKIEAIGYWTYEIYLKNIQEIDDEFEEILLTLNTMELGEEFAFTYEELEQIADDLIAGKDVKL